MAELKGVGRDHPLSIEKLCPVLSYYIVNDWREGCDRCKEILRYGGMGHTMSIHSQNDDVILEFGLHKPAYRICVNTPSTLGAIGFTTGLDPSMTLGCGGFGGNITSDNISPKHLLNIKRVAYETRAVTGPSLQGATGAQVRGAGAGRCRVCGQVQSGASGAGAPALPQSPSKPAPEPISNESLTRRIDAFLSVARHRGERTAGVLHRHRRNLGTSAPAAPSAPSAPAAPPTPAEFVCEDDVRNAVKLGQKILVGEKTIITPAARDAGEAAKVFTWQMWPS